MKNSILRVTALGTMLIAVVTMVLGGYTPFGVFDLTSNGVVICAWVSAICYIVANFSLTALFWKSQGGRRFLWDDEASCSALVMAQGFVLGLAILILYAIAPFNPVMGEAMKHPTLGMMCLGFFAVSLFFFAYALEAVMRKDWWNALHGGSMGGVMVSMALAEGGMFYILPLSMKACEVCIYVILSCMVLGLIAVFGPHWRDKIASRRYRRA